MNKYLKYLKNIVKNYFLPYLFFQILIFLAPSNHDIP